MAEADLLRLLPAIRRARDFHLYDIRGNRYLDLWLAGGKALLGHRPEGVVGDMKNVLARGLIGELPSIYERRLRQALALLLPGRAEFRIYRSLERLLAAVRPVVGTVAADEVSDPALAAAAAQADRPNAAIAWWRPFLPDPVLTRPAILLPVIPFEAAGPVVAAFREPPPPEVPQSDLVSPVLLAAMAKSVHLLVRFRPRYTEDEWRRYDSPFWRRVGPYLVVRCTEADYRGWFERLLSRGVLISPRYPGPSIVPAVATDGELAPLRELART